MEACDLICGKCRKGNFILKYEATYEYSYSIDTDAPGLLNQDQFLPFLYDNRIQKEAKQYVECSYCGARYPYYGDISKGINFSYIKEAIDCGENKKN